MTSIVSRREHFPLVEFGELSVVVQQGVTGPAGKFTGAFFNEAFKTVGIAGSLGDGFFPVQCAGDVGCIVAVFEQIVEGFFEVLEAPLVVGFGDGGAEGELSGLCGRVLGIGGHPEIGGQTHGEVVELMKKLHVLGGGGFQPDLGRQAISVVEAGFGTDVELLVFQAEVGYPGTEVEVSPFGVVKFQIGEGEEFGGDDFFVVVVIGARHRIKLGFQGSIVGRKRMLNISAANFECKIV